MMRETVHRLTHSSAVVDVRSETVDGSGMPFVSELLPNVAPKLRTNRGASWDHNSHRVYATAPGAVSSRGDTLYSPSASWQSERVIMALCGAVIAYLGRRLF